MHRPRLLALGVGCTALAVALAVPTAAPAATSPPTASPPLASAGSAPRATVTDVPAGLVRVRTRSSLLGTHTWYQQTFRGLPVIGGYYAVHTDKRGTSRVDDGRQAVPASLQTRPTVAASAAIRRADAALARRTSAGSKQQTTLSKPASTRATLAVRGGSAARLVWQVHGVGAAGTVQTLVDARSAVVLDQRSLSKNWSASQEGRGGTVPGRVFEPSPSVTLQTQDLRDRADSDQAVFNPTYRTVQLTDLRQGDRLNGWYARVRNQVAAVPSGGAFSYSRSDPFFEQVMAYHHTTVAQRYLQSLGFTDVNNESQDIYTNTIPDDNSFYDPFTDRMVFGRGGVDDAEDAEVIWHELGHAVQDDQVPGFGTSMQAGAIGEGFGDYLAVTMSVPVSNGYDLPCVADWDATSYTPKPHCLRRVDGTKTVADIVGQVHADGEIWSRALWDIHNSLGRERADTVIVESQFSYAPNTSFTAAATEMIRVARTLYGYSAARAVRDAFTARGIV
ncbi:MAG: M4 family metallopeptidase [Angustibacter sp.]